MMDEFNVRQKLYLLDLNISVEKLEQIISQFSDKDKKVLNLYFGLKNGICYDHEQIANKLRTTKMEVVQIIKKASDYFEKLNLPKFTNQDRALFEVDSFYYSVYDLDIIYIDELEALNNKLLDLVSYNEATKLMDEVKKNLLDEGKKISNDRYNNDEQIKLVTEYQKTKDKAIMEKLIAKNEGLIRNIASKHYGSSYVFDDFYQEGVIGFMIGVERFNKDFKIRLSTYVSYWIRQNINREIASKDTIIRMPYNMYEKKLKIKRAITKLNSVLHRDPTLEEIARETNLSLELVNIILDSNQQLASLNSKVGDGKETELQDYIENEYAEDFVEEIFDKELKEKINEALSLIPSREAEVIKLRYGLDGGQRRSLEEVGQIFHVTRERIRQIESRALRRLRQNIYNLQSFVNPDNDLSYFQMNHNIAFLGEYNPQIVKIFTSNAKDEYKRIIAPIVLNHLTLNNINLSPKKLINIRRCFKDIEEDIKKLYSLSSSNNLNDLLDIYNKNVVFLKTQVTQDYNYTTATIYFNCDVSILKSFIKLNIHPYSNLISTIFKNLNEVINLNDYKQYEGILLNLAKYIDEYKKQQQINITLEDQQVLKWYKEGKLTSVYSFYLEYTPNFINHVLNNYSTPFLDSTNKTFDLKLIFQNSKEFIESVKEFKKLLKVNVNLYSDNLISPKTLQQYLEISSENLEEFLDYLPDFKFRYLQDIFGDSLDKKAILNNEQLSGVKKHLDSYQKKKQLRKYNANLFDKLAKYDQKYVLLILDNSTADYKRVLQSIYGLDYTKKIRMDIISKDQKPKLQYALTNLKKTLEKNKTKYLNNELVFRKNLYDRYSNYAPDLLNVVLNSLSQKHQTILKKVYGPDYKNIADNKALNQDEKYLLYYIYKILEEALKKYNLDYQNGMSIDQIASNIKSKNPTLEERFKDYPSELVYLVINKLGIKYQQILKKVHKEDYQGKKDTSNLSNDEKKIYDSICYRYIPEKLKSYSKYYKINQMPNTMSLKRRFKNYSQELIDSVINNLELNEQLILKKVYGNNYQGQENVVNLNIEEKKIFDNLCLKKLPKLLFEAKAKYENAVTYNQTIYEYIKKSNKQYSNKLIDIILKNLPDFKLNLFKKAWDSEDLTKAQQRIALDKKSQSKLDNYIAEIRIILSEIYAKAKDPNNLKELINIYNQLAKNSTQKKTIKDLIIGIDNTYNYHQEIIDLIYRNEISDKYKQNFTASLEILVKKLKNLYNQAKNPDDLEEIKSLYLNTLKYKVINVEKVDNIKNDNKFIENVLLNSEVSNQLKKYLPTIKVYATILALESLVNVKLNLKQIALLLDINKDSACDYILEGLNCLQNSLNYNVENKLNEYKLIKHK